MDTIRIIHIEDFFIWLNLFGLIAIIGLITANNILYSCFLLILIYVIGMCVFFVFNAIFLGLVILMVYIGAIATLFLFIILMVDFYTRIEQKLDSEKVFSIFTICCTLLIIYYNMYGNFLIDYADSYGGSDRISESSNFSDIGDSIFKDHIDSSLFSESLDMGVWLDENISYFDQISYLVGYTEYNSENNKFSFLEELYDLQYRYPMFKYEKQSLLFSVTPTDIEKIGKIFYTYFCILFILCAFCLFVAIIGILIASEYDISGNSIRNYEVVIERKQLISEQINKLYTVEKARTGPVIFTRALCIIPSK
jgi:NADH:ubiquinone oxidoreductase subunit 6 (subunit J)